MSPFEAGMIVCFGISWPVAIRNTLKTRSVHGKSRMFLLLVLSGYGLGILHKVLYFPDAVVLLYAFNFTMVAIEVALWFRYRERPKPAIAARSARRDDGTADPPLAEVVRAPRPVRARLPGRRSA